MHNKTEQFFPPGLSCLHDGRIGTVTVTNDEAQFIVRLSEAGDHRLLKINNIYLFTLFGFSLNNIIDTVYFERIKSVSRALEVLGEIARASDSRVAIGKPELMAAHVIDQELSLLVVEPSWGGGALALARQENVTLHRCDAVELSTISEINLFDATAK